MKNINRMFNVIVGFTIAAVIFSGCSALMGGSKSSTSDKTNAAQNAVEVSKIPETKNSATVNNTSASNNNSSASNNNPSSKPAAPVKKSAAPQAAVKIPATSVPPVSKITAKPSSTIPVPTNTPAVQAANTDALYNLVESYAGQGKDLVINFGGDVQETGIIDKVMNDLQNSEYSGYISGIDYSLDNTKAYIHFNYKEGKDTFLSQINIVNSKVQQIIGQVIKPGMSDFDKELALHDYVVNHTRYDYNNLINNTLPDDSFTAYGLFTKGTAVCEGYAEAMFRLLNEAGIKCLIITGKGNGVAHEWNLVNIGGAYYHLDATFDDPVSSSGDVIIYNYFNVSDGEISKDHSWNTALFPTCSSNSLNYYVYYNLIANSKADFYNIVKNGLQNRLAVIRCKTTSYNPQIFTPDIVYNIVKDNPSIYYVDLSNGYFYSYDQNTGVMEFHMSYK